MFFQRNRLRIAVWVGMLLYLVFAHDLYNHFFLRTGKPVLVSAELPKRTDQIHAGIDRFEATFYDGQYSYVMIGWAFSVRDPAIPPEAYERQVILISEERNYFFSTENQPRADVQEVYKPLGLDLIRSGFSTMISRETIVPGVYRVGVSFHNPENGSTRYTKLDTYLIRTPNQLILSDSPSLP